MDVSFDNEIGVVTAVLAISSGAVHEGGMTADEFGADRPFLRIIGNFAEEEKDGIAAREFELLGCNPGGPFMEFVLGVGGGRCGIDDRGRLTPLVRARIQFTDFVSNGFLDGFFISQVQAVEFGIGVAKFCGIGYSGRGPELSLVFGERRQIWNGRYSQIISAVIQFAYPCPYRWGSSGE